MTPTVETVAAEPAQPAAFLTSEIIGLRNAIERCGACPEIITVERYCQAVYDAGREVERIERVWRRYCRRFNLPETEIDASPTRLHVRHLIVLDIYSARCEWSKLLIFGPMAGCA
jgi:hypothetical protein